MIGIVDLLAATIAFVGSHFLLSHPLRTPLAGRLGEQRFLLLYGGVAVVTFGWFVAAAIAAPPGPVWWIAPQGAWDAATLVMLGAGILLVGSLVGNPALVDPTQRPAIPDQPRGVLAITRHPMMAAVTLWAVVHVILWGTPANLIVSAGLGCLALFGSLGQDIKKRRLLGEAWRGWVAKTSFWPFGAQLTGRASWRAALPRPAVLFGGLAVWLIATGLHPWFGGPAAGPWRWLP